MRRLLIILLLTLIILSGCSKYNSETTINLALTNLKLVDNLPSELSIDSYDKDLFKVDTEYLKSIDTPSDTIDYIKNQYLQDVLVTFSDTNVFYFVGLDVMTNFGVKKYKIYSRDKTNSKLKCIYVSESDDVTKEIFSAVVYNNCLYWSENHLNVDDSPEWFIKKLDLSNLKVYELCNNKDIKSGIIPVLSSNQNGVYWYTGSEINGEIKYNIMNYNDKNGIVILFSNVICNNPYTKYISSYNSDVVLTNKGFIGHDLMLPIDSPDLVSYYSSTDKYIVWVQLPEKDNYLNQTMYIYDIKNNNLFTIKENDFCGNIMGCGIIKDYVYINISNGIDKYNGIYLLDLLNNNIYDLNKVLNYETYFSWPVISENGKVCFYGEKIFEID